VEQELLGAFSLKNSLKASPPGFHLAVVSSSLSRCGQLKVTPVGRVLDVPLGPTS